MPQAKSLLHEMTLTTVTEFWNDACDVASLERAVSQGATGATSNPVIVLAAIKQHDAHYRDVVRAMLAERPSATETELAWALVERAARDGAQVLLPLFRNSGGRRGRLSVQVDPTLHPNSEAMVAHAEHLMTLAPNIAIKVPATAAGVVAVEELTARGIPVNATVSFSVAQALAVAEAVERGLVRARPGVDVSRVTPWCTIMVGRLDDHLRDLAKQHGLAIAAETIRWASTCVFRRAYRLYRERGYRTKLLAAAMRSHHHWSEFIGGDVVITVPPNWQDTFNASGVAVAPRIDQPIPAEIESELHRTFPDFVRAYEPEGMRVDEFAAYGATKKTLHQFLAGYQELLAFVRGVMLPL